MIDTIFFDNWNTLVQAPELMRRGGSTEAFHRYLEMQGVEVPYDKLVEVYVPISRDQMRYAEAEGYREPDYRQRLEDVFNALGLEDYLNLSIGAWRYYLGLWPEQTTFFPGVPKMLAELKQGYKLGVITNYMDGPTCRRVFAKLRYDDIFDSLVVSHELGYMKPAGLLFETAMRETGSKPENCVMVGDSYEADVVGGNLAGMKTVFIDINGDQGDYYDDCSLVIRSIDEFPSALKSLAE